MADAQPVEQFDVVVIGGGPAGENVADRCDDCGASIAVVEAELLAGECSYWACMPSKALLRPGEVLAEVRRDILWHAVPVFPTVSEVWLRLLEADGL
jgi:pyruvate/2-oxoglutarate dehydrogenase complex dihydrolipoamide dehydrogenase (E3) component